MNTPTSSPRIHDYLAKPQEIPLRKLVALTRDYHRMSAFKADDPRSNYHRWYYLLANECERRGLELARVIKR